MYNQKYLYLLWLHTNFLFVFYLGYKASNHSHSTVLFSLNYNTHLKLHATFMFFVETCFYFWCFLICFVVTEVQLKFHFSYFGYFVLRFPLLFYYQNITLVWWCLLVLLFISLISGIRLHFFMHTLVFPWLMQRGKLQVLYCKMLLILVFYLQY